MTPVCFLPYFAGAMAQKLMLLLALVAAVGSERLERLDAASMSGDRRARQNLIRVHAQHQVATETTTQKASDGSSGTSGPVSRPGSQEFMKETEKELQTLQKGAGEVTKATDSDSALVKSATVAEKAAQDLQGGLQQWDEGHKMHKALLVTVAKAVQDHEDQRAKGIEYTLHGHGGDRKKSEVVEVTPSEDEKNKGTEEIVISDFSEGEHGITFVQGTGGLSPETEKFLTEEFQKVLKEAKDKVHREHTGHGSTCIVCIYYSTSAKENNAKNGLMDDRKKTLEDIVDTHVKAVVDGGYTIEGRYPTYGESRFGAIVIKFYDAGKAKPQCDPDYKGAHAH